MCPSAPIPPPHSIDYHADDMEMLMHLESMVRGDPRPVNVLDVNPYTVAPWNLPPSMLYFFTLQGTKGNRTAEGGYWETTAKDYKTLAQSPTMGSITKLEFYRGQDPRGVKTNWAMHEYTMDQNLMGSCSLCRVFNRSDHSHSEEHQQAGADEANGEFVQAMLLSMLEYEENNPNVQDSSNMSQVLSRNGHEPQMIYGSSMQLDISARTRVPDEAYDFSKGDYLEWNDLDFAPSSSCSEKIFIGSMTSKEYLHPEALLRHLETPTIPDTQQQKVDCRRHVSTSRGAHQVLIQPPLSGPLGSSSSSSSNRSLHTKKTVVSASMPFRGGGLNSNHPATIVEKLLDRKASKRASAVYDVNEVNHGPSTSQGAISVKAHHDRKAVGRITKLRKKYCCFLSF